jgi:uncharacterized protein (TIGR00369 family)
VAEDAPFAADKAAASWRTLGGDGLQIPFVVHMGFSLDACADGHSEISYSPLPEHHNSLGVTHGGAIMTLLDVSMATAARSDTPGQGVVTIEMKTSFMQAASGPLTARGQLLHRTATLAFTQSTIYDAKGRACAMALGTFKYLKEAARSATLLQRAASGSNPE